MRQTKKKTCALTARYLPPPEALGENSHKARRLANSAFSLQTSFAANAEQIHIIMIIPKKKAKKAASISPVYASHR